MMLMEMKVMGMAFSCAASILALAAPSAMPAPAEAQEQRAVDAKQSRSGAEVNKMTPTKKIAGDPEAEPFESSKRGFEGLSKRFLEDQKQIWTSPARLRFSDTGWLVPLSGITAGLFVTDRDFSKNLSQNPTTISHYKTLSNAGVGALIGGPCGWWLLGAVLHRQHWSETGF